MLSCFSRVRLFATLWTVAHRTPLSMGFSRQEYPTPWSGLPCPSPGSLPNPALITTPLYQWGPEAPKGWVTYPRPQSVGSRNELPIWAVRFQSWCPQALGWSFSISWPQSTAGIRFRVQPRLPRDTDIQTEMLCALCTDSSHFHCFSPLSWSSLLY